MNEHIADSAFWEADSEHRHLVFATLREKAPVRWFEPHSSRLQRNCSGFWALTRYEDVWTAARNPTVFCSRFGIDIEQTPEEFGPEVRTMINLDDPEHFRLRRLVSSAFTAKRITALDQRLRLIATQIIDDLLLTLRHRHRADS